MPAASAQHQEPEVVGEILSIPRARIRRYALQPRKYFDPKEIEELAASIQEWKQQVCVKVRRVTGDPNADFELVDGERRFMACELAKVDYVRAEVTTVKDDDEQFIMSMIANFGRSGHTVEETAKAITRVLESKKLKGMKRSKQIEYISKICAKSVSWVYQFVHLESLDPEVRDMINANPNSKGSMARNVARVIKRVPDVELQRELAREVRSEAKNSQHAINIIRRRAKEVGISVDNRELRPSDHYKLFDAFIDRLTVDIERVAEMPLEKIGEFLQKRSQQRRNEMLRTVDDGIALLKRIRTILIEAGAQKTAA